MATKGSSEQIKTSEEQDRARRAAKQSRTPKKGRGQTSQTTPGFNVLNEGRALQAAAIYKELAAKEVNAIQRSFLDAMVSVFAELEKSDLTVNGKRISAISVTFAKIKTELGDDVLEQFKKDWSEAKTVFFRSEKAHPLNRYCDQARAAHEARTRASEEHLTQTLGSLINTELLSA